ncbi:MAG TPA: sarcosine oxidase subunit alpha family protein [Acetobacteraceae bacterium]|nr:sarcosine oxidase subunit alpha family protein [Acetobacteraceae bacterium]
MSQSFRTQSGGHIDRGRLLRFRFDGHDYQGHPGDTLASALLANGVRLVGRSFKLHRPRGVFAAGVEEPNALAELRSGVRREPNTRMTMVELYDGLQAASQNRFPSLRFDVMAAAAGVASPLLGAGFYYKTFMWPAAFWEKVYEPWIRRAAGLGRASGVPDPDQYEAMHAHCDVLVVGSGAAGLAAARVAGTAGARVILCEQDFTFGGGLLAERPHELWREQTLAALSAMPEVMLLPRSTVFGYYDGNTVGVVERVADHLPEPPPHAPRQRYWTIRAKSVVLATGAHERFIAFPGNDRPGVMLAGAAAVYATRYGVRPGRRAVLFANNDAAYESLFALQEAGVEIAGAVDARPDSAGAAAARERGIAVWAGEIVATNGRLSLHGVSIRQRGGAETRIAADLLCVSGGINPAVHLASQSGTPLVWDDRLASFVPGEPLQSQQSAGAAAGVTGIAAAAADGARAGAAATRAAGFVANEAIELPHGDSADPTVLPVWEVKARGKAFVDIQDDVTTNDIRLAHREGYRHIEHAKRYTTHTMGTEQGKTGGLIGAAVLAEARGERVQDVGLPTFRPFTSPVTWGAIAGARVGKHFVPLRLTPMHSWHVQRGAEFVDAGQWLRPGLYPKPNDTDAWATVLREARAVRQAEGVCDVSTLGKIDVQGGDAAAFLDRVYANTFSNLPVGRARYGLMLREDGIVFDDGTTSRLAPDHFFVTTTTANAGPVMAHLEFHLQTCWPELDVQVASVTDQWASMSVAGPRARDALRGIVRGIDLSNEAFPFMAVSDAEVADCPVRVFRISFSGEMAYEIATPWGYGLRVWEAVMQAGAAFGIEPYGMEALGLLRIEKGHVAGPELNGQTTAADLGLGRMLKKRGDFIGRMLAQRPGLTDPDRPRLVGVMSADRSGALRAGAHLVEPGSTDSLGWITSVTRSVELDRWIGLAMLRGGTERQRLDAAFPLKNEVVAVDVVSPHFVDPENVRVRA